ncbi:MAG: hydrogenase formation protein HypD [Candidatus Aminicenantes bacterium]|nr:MAG: hydrogenase formation protein HypD [Candidatus Aminicenantes bacterium]
MKELRDKQVIRGLLSEIERKARVLQEPAKIMEVCGTHTMTIHKFGLRKLLEEAGVEMLSGPGCPVCITPNEIHQAAIELVTERDNYILTTFGDMTRVPTQQGSLQTVVPASGSTVKIVYSPTESLEIAKQNPQKEVVFFGVGFETTIPAIILTAQTALTEKVSNYSVLSALWIIPPPLRAILEAKDTEIQGFLYPGHVSAIIGEEPYRFIADEFGIPGCITGFEPSDILLAISSILDQITEGKARIANEYSRVVRPSGNIKAQALMKDICDTRDAHWRGLGLIPQSGLKLKDEYSTIDAEVKYGLDIVGGSGDLPGCRCGDVLKGKISPPECSFFGNKCHPDSPYGPCMVSFEGACLAYYKYEWQ